MPALLNSLNHRQCATEYFLQNLRFVRAENAIVARTGFRYVVALVCNEFPVRVAVTELQSALGDHKENISLFDNSLVSGSVGHGADSNPIRFCPSELAFDISHH